MSGFGGACIPPRQANPWHADASEIRRFVSALFRYAREGTIVSLRAFDQNRRDIPPRFIRPVRINGDLDHLIREATVGAEDCAQLDAPAVFCSPICTFTGPWEATTAALANGLSLSVELDDVDPNEARQKLEQLLGPVTVAVASGSDWVDPSSGEVKPNTHLHWRLNEPTTTHEDHARLRDARSMATLLSGGDPTGKPVVHPLRLPGSWNLKAEPRMAKILVDNPDAEIDLGDALERLEEAVEAAGLREHDGSSGGASSEPQARYRDVRSAMAAIPNFNADVHYDTWIRLGYAVHRALGGGTEAYEVWNIWSRLSEKYKEDETEAAWERIESAIRGATPPRTVGAGTIFFLAARAGWVRPSPFCSTSGSRSRETNEPDGAGETWPEPVDILADQDPGGAPILTGRHIPDALWPFVADTAERMGVATSTVALCAIVSCASVICEDWRLQPKRFDDTWTERARLWGAPIGLPSIMKSPVIALATAPIDRLEIAAREQWNEEMAAWRVAVAAWKAGDKKDPEPVPPRCARYLVESVTVEALQEVLRDDADGKFTAPLGKILSRQDELAEFLANMDRYSTTKGGGDRGAWLRLYNGGRYSVDRIRRGSFVTKSWSGCLLGGIQPDPIQQIARNATDDGLMQRIMFDVPVPRGPGQDRAPNHAALDAYHALFPALAASRPARAPSGRHTHVVLHADAHASRESIDATARAMSLWPDASPQLQSAFGKWSGLFARLCLTFHLIEIAAARAAGERGPSIDVVSVETAARVRVYMREILAPMLLRADAIMFASRQSTHAAWIANFIIVGALDRVAARDIVQHYRPLRAPEQRETLENTMDSLCIIGWLRPEPPRGGSLKPTAWRVNPDVHLKFAERAAAERARRAAVRADIAAHVDQIRSGKP
jgi:hypothetical protein